ncbi:MAG TPA: acyl carrier protein [Candidatus Acidoferrum sp.]|nr:acyl carrier protein [Candidatus Acidoferrum sp.]
MSESEAKLRQAFARGLNIAEAEVNETLQYGSTRGWDSVAHMSLIASLDSMFDIMLDIDDVLDLASYDKARGILVKYGVQF